MDEFDSANVPRLDVPRVPELSRRRKAMTPAQGRSLAEEALFAETRERITGGKQEMKTLEDRIKALEAKFLDLGPERE
jgi:hypothetical protein